MVMGLAVYRGHTWGIVGAAFGIAAIVWATRRDPSGPDGTQSADDADELSDD